MPRLNRLPMWMLVSAWVAVGTALPAVYGWARGVRDPNGVLVHDEASYLLQADTFARGRMTNPSPNHPEFFESPYLLMVPTYQAKYPPGQAVLLAIGKRLFGHPIWGVWLSCGLFAGALYWMLSGWTNRHWAMLGTEYAVIVLGVNHYWATTYWGGMVAAWGGALVLGGTRWTIRRWSTGRAVLTGLGAVILANSRLYEGCVTCLACAPVLAWWLLRGPAGDRVRKAVGWCGPFVLVVAVGGAATALYNQSVTGSWSTLPYALHQRQYLTCGVFRWQPINRVPERRLTTRVGQFYETDRLLNPGQRGGTELGALAVAESVRTAFLDLFRNFVSPTSLLPKGKFGDRTGDGWWPLVIFLGTSAWFVCTTRRWGSLHAAWMVIILMVLAGGAVWCNLLHYQAPVVCLCYFLVVDWLRRAALVCRRTWLPRAVRGRQVILAFCLLVPAVFLESRLERAFGALWASPAEAVPHIVSSPASLPVLSRPELLAFLSRQSRPVLAVVSYDRGVPQHEEWVYNSADLNSQRVILAHDLGPQKLPRLLSDFPGRDLWRVRVTARGATAELDNERETPAFRVN